MERKQRFSLRKYKSGMVSVLVGSIFITGMQVAANEVQGESTPSISNLAVKSTEQTEAELEGTPKEQVPLVEAHSTEAETAPVNMATHDLIKTSDAWDKGYKGQGMVVAIIDTGIDAEHQAMRISFDMEKADPGTIRVHFDQLLPEDSEVYLTPEDGQFTRLDQSLYMPEVYGKVLNEGNYTIQVDLPNGYHVSGKQSIKARQNDVVGAMLKILKENRSAQEKGRASHQPQSLVSHVRVLGQPKQAAMQKLPSTGDKTQSKFSLLGMLLLTGLASSIRKRQPKNKR